MPINDVAKKFDKKRDKLGLGPDEQILAGCMTNPMAAVGMAVGGIAGAAVQAAVNSATPKPDGAGIAGTWPQGRHLVAITSKRVVVAEMGVMTGRPTKLIAEFANSDIVSFDVEKKLATYHFAITFTDGSTAQGQAAKGSGSSELSDAAASVWH